MPIAPSAKLSKLVIGPAAGRITRSALFADWRTALPYLVLTLLFVYTWVLYAANIPYRQAYLGFTPFEWLQWRANPELFARDFSDGIDYGKSSFMWFYVVAHEVLGFPAQHLSKGVVGFELLLVAFALRRFASVVVPNLSPVALVGSIVAYWLSYALIPNLARFGTPFAGLYYNVAASFLLLSLTAFLDRRYLAAGVLMGLTFTVHPVYGAIGGTALFAMVLARLGEIRTAEMRAAAIGATCFIAIALSWLYFVMESGVAPRAAIPDADWYFFTELTNSHWYPLSLGVLTSAADQRLVPFLAFTALAAHYFSLMSAPGAMRRVLVALVVALFILTFAGVLISVVKPSTVLIKLAFHRASLMILVIGLPFVIAGLVRDLVGGGLYRQLAALVALWGIFSTDSAYPVISAVLVTAPVWRQPGGAGSAASRVAAFVSIALIVFVAVYFAADILTRPRVFAAVLGRSGEVQALLVGGFLLAASRLVTTRLKELAAYALPLALIIAWYPPSLYANLELSSTRKQAMQDFLELQSWAAENTPPKSLFMMGPRPVPVYAWRAFSMRPSFGSFREWMYLWSYRSDGQMYRRGLERLGLFEIDWTLDRYRPRPSKAGYRKLLADLKTSFLAKDSAWFQALAQRHGVDYIVVATNDVSADWCFEVAMANSSFTIIDLSSGCTE